MALTITVITDASLTASVSSNGILATITQTSATLNIGLNTPGASATVEVGTTTTGNAGTDASVVNVGTASHAVLDFTIPRGDKGDQGDQGVQGIQGIQGVKGDKGDQGEAATIDVFATNTLPPDEPAYVENFGTPQNASFVFNIPQGFKGDQGERGQKGDTGDTGAGVIPGGTAGQVLAKIDGTSYNTEWITITSGGGTWGSITGTLSSQTDLQNALNDKLSLTGGSMSGGIVLTTGGDLSNTITESNIYILDTNSANHTNLTNGYLNFYSDSGPVDSATYGASGFNIGGGLLVGTNTGITFPDSSVQTTAGLPLTGGSMTGDLTIAGGANPVYLNITGDGGKSLEFGTDTYFKLGNSGIGIDLTFDNNGLSLNGSGNYLYFPDSSFQTTAFPPTGGTTSQYIDGTGALQTYGPLGDRYLTSSTSTLTCDSGNGKTMTVGTGLSYSRQQDITVSYDTANHMHGTVLTYNSTTGVMTFDANTHSGGGTYSSWEVNVGGVAGAVLPVDGTAGQVLAKINSTNFNTEWISLGSMAQATATDYLAKAGNLSGLASAASSRTNLGLGAVATDAYATTAQAQAGTSTTSVISPATLLDAKFFAGFKPLSMVWTWTSSVSGVGASTTSNGQVKNVFSATAAVGSAMAYIFNYNTGRGLASSIGADFTKRTTIGGRFIKTVTTADANSVFRFLLGKNITSPPAGDLAQRGIGFRQVANGALELQVHNGTTLYNVTSSFTPTANQAYDVVIVADAGTATMYVNGSSVATSANAPTATLGSTVGILDIEAQNTSILSGSAMTYSASDMFVQTNL